MLHILQVLLSTKQVLAQLGATANSAVECQCADYQVLAIMHQQLMVPQWQQHMALHITNKASIWLCVEPVFTWLQCL